MLQGYAPTRAQLPIVDPMAGTPPRRVARGIGDPIDLEVFIQPLSSDEQADLGLQSKTTCRVIGREGWPEGVSAKVLITKGPYQGRTFDQEGEPRRFGMSPRIYHYDVLITSRGTEVP